MKSNKQKRKEIKQKRLKKAQKLSGAINACSKANIPACAIAADIEILKQYNPLTYYCYPHFYIDRSFKCKDCGSEEIWTAMQQKWWYEIAGGKLEQVAVRCRPCRKIERERKALARKTYFEGMTRKHHKQNNDAND